MFVLSSIDLVLTNEIENWQNAETLVQKQYADRRKFLFLHLNVVE